MWEKVEGNQPAQMDGPGILERMKIIHFVNPKASPSNLRHEDREISHLGSPP